MPKLHNHILINNARGHWIVVNSRTRDIVGRVEDILKDPKCEEICKQFMPKVTQQIKLPSNFDPDWEGYATHYGYQHYVSDGMQSAFAKGFYLMDNTATESFKSFLKIFYNEQGS